MNHQPLLPLEYLRVLRWELRNLAHNIKQWIGRPTLYLRIVPTLSPSLLQSNGSFSFCLVAAGLLSSVSLWFDTVSSLSTLFKFQGVNKIKKRNKPKNQNELISFQLAKDTSLKGFFFSWRNSLPLLRPICFKFSWHKNLFTRGYLLTCVLHPRASW